MAEGIRYIVFVEPEKYYRIPDTATRSDISRAIGHLNKQLENKQFILMGPGRWGSTNMELGVPVSYADIYNTRVLIEMAIIKDGQSPELSYGTHFFQDLVESGIYSLPLRIGEGKGSFNWEFFQNAPNCLESLSPDDVRLSEYLKVIDVTAVAGHEYRLKLVMNGITDEAVAYLETGDWPLTEEKLGQVSSF